MIADITGWLGYPLRGPNGILGALDESLAHTYTRVSSSDYSALGPLAIVTLLVASVIATIAYIRRRADARQLALACALPCFLVLISLSTTWTSFLIRFFTVPAALAAPLLAGLIRGRATTAAYGAVAALTISLTVIHDQAKPLRSPYGYGWSWNLTRTNALKTNSRGDYALEVDALDRTVSSGCLGAIVGESDPTFYLYGTRFQRHIIYLPQGNPVTPALAHGLTKVVVNAALPYDANQLKLDGWKVRPMGGDWLLGTRKPSPGSTPCKS